LISLVACSSVVARYDDRDINPEQNSDMHLRLRNRLSSVLHAESRLARANNCLGDNPCAET